MKSLIRSLLLISLLCVSSASSKISRSRSITKMSMPTKTITKEIILIRHGTTEMNEVLHANPWGSESFVDAGLWDTRLSRQGIEDAKLLNKRVLSKDSGVGDFKRVELLICSPLTRALQTAEIGLAGDVLNKDIKRIVHPLARERLYLSSDVGRPKLELQRDYSNWNYDFLEDNEWWFVHPKDKKYTEWRPRGTYSCEGEVEDFFKERMLKLKQFLNEREEKIIAIICHWAVCRALTGKSLENCEVVSIQSDRLLEEPFIDKA